MPDASAQAAMLGDLRHILALVPDLSAHLKHVLGQSAVVYI